MNSYESLLEEACRDGVEVYDYPFTSERIRGLYCDRAIAIRQGMTTVEKEMHAIFDVTTTQNIAAVDLYNFIDSIFESADIYSELYNVPIKKNEFSIKATINSPGPVEIITCAAGAFILLASLSLFINGAKAKFSFDIFNVVKGNVDIDSPGLIDKIRDFKTIATENEIKLQKTQAKIEESRKKLKIKKKENKK